MGMKDEYINRMGRNRKRHLRLRLFFCNVMFCYIWVLAFFGIHVPFYMFNSTWSVLLILQVEKVSRVQPLYLPPPYLKYTKIKALFKFNLVNHKISQQKVEVFEVEEPYKSIISNIDNGWAEMGCQLTEDERLTVVSDPLYKMVSHRVRFNWFVIILYSGNENCQWRKA